MFSNMARISEIDLKVRITSIVGERMAVRILWIESPETGLSSAQKLRVVSTIRRHTVRAARLLKLPLVNITVLPTKDGHVIPETGEGGADESKEWVRIDFDPSRLKSALKHIPATIYHEFHHLARMRRFAIYSTLLDAVIANGLAIVFEEEQLPGYVDAIGSYTKRDMKRYMRIFARGLGRRYDFPEWFFGTGKLPRWMGYKVGTYIVRLAKQNSGLTALQMTKMPAKKILRLSRVRIK
jgi:uncharacterized protein YjaZ